MTSDFAGHHRRFWEWVWSVENGVAPPPFVAVWPRGGAKSTSIELACVVLGARQARHYVLYVCGTQQRADNHVATIASMLTSSKLENVYPLLGQRSLSKYGNVLGWRRNRLWTAAGLIIDAIGLDTATRGVKLEAQRPDLIVLDDIDEATDSLRAADSKMQAISRNLLPAGSNDVAVVAVQNLIIPHGVFSRLANHPGAPRCEILGDRIISGPVPAIGGMQYEEDRTKPGTWRITAGVPAWSGQNLAVCERQLNLWGPSAFDAEAQHAVDAVEGGLFSGITFRYAVEGKDGKLYREKSDGEVSKKPVALFGGAVWVDPAVTDTDRSDSHGLTAASIGEDGLVYIRYSWEGRTSPLDSMKRAIKKAIEYGIDRVGVETDQGGDTWDSVYQQACYSLGIRMRDAPKFVSEKAGAGFGSKIHRATQMLADYERARIVHVRGTHHVLERALKRFPVVKPFDLVDSEFWAWDDVRKIWAGNADGGGGPQYGEVKT